MPAIVIQTRAWNAFGCFLQPILRVLDDTHITGKIFMPLRPTVLPQPHQPLPATPLAQVDEVCRLLDSRKDAWVATDTQQRAALLEECTRNIMALAEQLAAAGTAAKGSYEGGTGEEMSTVLPIVNALLEYHEAMAAGGCCPPLELERRPDGQWVAHVWPRRMVPAFFPNFRGEVWIMPGQLPTQGALYRHKRDDPSGAAARAGVALVLGAGNQLPVVALDILHMLLSEDLVVCVKMNPVNDYYGPLLRKAFAPFVSRGWLEFVYGGADVGAHCTHHPLVKAIHLTGSEATYNAIMFGDPTPTPHAVPRLSKPVTAELGNVTPYIIVPGPWSQRDIEYHATNVASGLAQNTGHNCIAAEIIITDAAWPQRAAFVTALTRCLAALSCRGPWYPGSAARLAAFKQRFPQAQVLGRPVPEAGQPPGHVAAEPWMLATGVAPEEAQTSKENWGGVLQEVPLTGCADTEDFLARAVAYANDTCHGTLAASIFIHPQTQKAHTRAYDAAVASLRYGAVTVNCPALVAFSATPLVWGAFPGNSPQSIGSGVGFVHNTYLFDHPQKSVLRAPWTYSPQPLWSVGQLGLTKALPPAFRFMVSQHNPLVALYHLVVVALHALRGSWRPAKWKQRV